MPTERNTSPASAQEAAMHPWAHGRSARRHYAGAAQCGRAARAPNQVLALLVQSRFTVNGDGRVTVAELVHGVAIALGDMPLDGCRAFDPDGDGRVDVDELVQAVRKALML